MAGRGELLLEGERLALELRRHAYVLTGPVLVLFVCCGTGAYLLNSVPDSGSKHLLRAIIGVAVGLIGLRWAVWPWLRWYGRRYLITNNRVIIREGLRARHGAEVSLGRVVDLVTQRSVLQRICGAGRLTIRYSGTSTTGELVLDDLGRINDVSHYIAGLVATSPRIAWLPTDPPPGPDPALPDLY